MTVEMVMTIIYLALKTGLTLAGPILLAALAVGLLISIFQAATQINEMTLSFIPKLLAVAAAIAVLGPWMIQTMVDYIRSLLMQIPSLVV